MFRNSLKMFLGGKPRKNHSGGGSGLEPEGSEVRMMEGFTRSLPSSPLLNLRLVKRTGRVSSSSYLFLPTSFIFVSLSPLCAREKELRTRKRRTSPSDLLTPPPWNPSEPISTNQHCKLVMDCTAAILKACARSRTKWCRHERPSVRRPWRPGDGCSCGADVTAVTGHASSLLRRLLLYACCCQAHEDSSELCRERVDRPGEAQRGGRGRSEEEGEEDDLGPPPSVDEAADALMTRLGFLLGEKIMGGEAGSPYHAQHDTQPPAGGEGTDDNTHASSNHVSVTSPTSTLESRDSGIIAERDDSGKDPGNGYHGSSLNLWQQGARPVVASSSSSCMAAVGSTNNSSLYRAVRTQVLDLSLIQVVILWTRDSTQTQVMMTQLGLNFDSSLVNRTRTPTLGTRDSTGTRALITWTRTLMKSDSEVR
ncbi:hypothetical protein FQN60_003457 [Etheostoma spectabile]|uniref:Uncharacterized protein n=1 Tax=Etheostoma spectabile TaxID=54343 RepID=A0A5J5CVC4_9PERO|nr:hypothetical protein FQN60_003457 [Etheostoma spectabile]